MSHLIFNFVLSELLSVKIEQSKYNQILNWILIGVQFSAMSSFKLLIFVASELLGAKLVHYTTKAWENAYVVGFEPYKWNDCE